MISFWSRQIAAIKVMNRRYYQLNNSLYYDYYVQSYLHWNLYAFRTCLLFLKSLAVILFLGCCVVKCGIPCLSLQLLKCNKQLSLLARSIDQQRTGRGTSMANCLLQRPEIDVRNFYCYFIKLRKEKHSTIRWSTTYRPCLFSFHSDINLGDEIIKPKQVHRAAHCVTPYLPLHCRLLSYKAVHGFSDSKPAFQLVLIFAELQQLKQRPCVAK